jgi:hypothetical protein
MAKGFKHGATGTALNFNVVGNPQPVNPKENTIWIDTDTPITSFEFRATEPPAPLEGMVWIQTGTSSTVEFNALKKNGIQVYPISASQYVGGTWVSKTTKTYQNGELTGWERYLYKSGDEFDSCTGGWIGEARNFPAGNGGQIPTITRNPTDLSVKGIAYRGSVVRCENTIDITGYSNLEFDGILKNEYSQIYIWTSTEGHVGENAVTTLKGPVNGSCTLDLSNVPSGKYYIGFALYHDGAAVTMNSLKLT